ncbi:hypothetical protein ACFL3H_09195 [Gemmatimonadota bacterium]
MIERPLLYLLLGIAIFHVVTMPRFTYPGDNFAPRAACVSLLTTGDIGIEASASTELGSFLTQRGQYFFEREVSGKFYSKYGIGNTLLYLPPLLAERLTGGEIGFQSGSTSLLVWMNLWSIVLTLVATVFLYRIVSLYTARPLIRVGFILVLYYTTFVWYYLRSPSLEIFQIVPFVAFLGYLLRYLRGRQGEREMGKVAVNAAPGSDSHLIQATVWLGVLVLMKLFFVILIPVVWFFVISAGPRTTPLRARWQANCSKTGIRLLVRPLLLPTAAIIVLLLVVNQIKFGSPFNSGYGQWQGADGQAHDHFGISYLITATTSFLFKPGNANVFIHVPPLLVALFGLPAFLRRHRSEALFLLTVAGTIFVGVSCFSSWAGEWCYGPRYLLPIALIGTLPRIEVGEWLLKVPRRVAAPITILIGVVLLWSFGMQVRINSLHYFSFYRTQAFFAAFPNPEISGYYKGLFHRGVLHRDLIRYREGRGEFLPATILREMVPLEAREEVDRELSDYLNRAVEPNFLFF